MTTSPPPEPAAPPLKFTGERYVPDEGWASIAYEHISRYLMMGPLAQGKTVLDIGCGEGYGSRLLARSAHSVVGVDISAEAVGHARSRYGEGQPNLRYEVSTATALPFPDASFDLVVCFEMLEHITEQEDLVRQARRVLRPGGIFVVSTPNRYTYSDVPHYSNPFHVKELYLDEFRALMASVFPATTFLAQRNITGSLISELDDAPPRPIAIQRVHRSDAHNRFEPVPPGTLDHLYYIAFASDDAAVFAPLRGMLMVDRDDRLSQEPGEVAHAHLMAVEKNHALQVNELTAGMDNLTREQNAQLDIAAAADGVMQEVTREVRRAEQIDWDDVPPEQHVYDLIIPNYNAREVTKICLESLLRHTDPKHHIYIVDDCSPDPLVMPMLEDFARRFSHIHVTRLPQNVGFSGAVNTGLGMSTRDVVLINSDTEYSPQWLARIDRCRRSDPRIHIVSPLSNNATICSVPQLNAKNQLPEGVTVTAMARLVAQSSLRRYPRVPTAVGFCMMVTRALINDIGTLDMIFGRGYGEEVDWCQRAWAKGYESALCDDAYVYHHGEVSMSTVADTRIRQQTNEQLVAKRWPHYHRSVREFCLLNPLRFQHQRLFERLRRGVAPETPRVLHVVHSYEAAGGTELYTRHLATRLAPGIASAVLYPSDNPGWTDAACVEEPDGLIRVMMNRGLLPTAEVINGAPMELRSRVVERFFGHLMAGMRPDIVHFQHLLGYGSFLLPAIARRFGAKVVMTLHDYFMLCADWNLMEPGGALCGKVQADSGQGCVSCLDRKRTTAVGKSPTDLASWIRQRRPLLKSALDAADVLIAPSAFVREQFRAAYGNDLVKRVVVVPHGTEPQALPPRRPPADRLRVAFLGNMTQAKGGGTFLDAATLLRDEKMRFRVIGGVPPGTQLGNLPNLQVMGTYRPDQLPKLLESVDIVVIGSVWHETYCYTLDEAYRAGIPVIATRVGAIQERVVDGKTGLLVSPGDGRSLADAILRLHRDRKLLTEMVSNVRMLSCKTLAQNLEEYGALYRGLVAATFDSSDLMRRRMSQERAA